MYVYVCVCAHVCTHTDIQVPMFIAFIIIQRAHQIAILNHCSIGPIQMVGVFLMTYWWHIWACISVVFVSNYVVSWTTSNQGTNIQYSFIPKDKREPTLTTVNQRAFLRQTYILYVYINEIQHFYDYMSFSVLLGFHLDVTIAFLSLIIII